MGFELGQGFWWDPRHNTPLTLKCLELVTLTFDLWPWFSSPVEMLSQCTPMSNFMTLGHTGLVSNLIALTAEAPGHSRQLDKEQEINVLSLGVGSH